MVLGKVLYIVCDDTYFLSHRLPLAQYTQQKGVEVVVACSNTGKFEQIEKAGFKVIDLEYDRTKKLADFQLFFKLRKIIKQEQPDIVHNVALRMVFVSMLSIKSLWGSDKIGSVNAVMGLGHLFTHNSLKTKLLRVIIIPILRWLFKNKNSRVIVQNQDDYKIFKTYMTSEDKLALIKGSGVNLGFYRPRDKQRYSEDDDYWHISMVSRLVETKGIYEYFGAAKLLEKQGVKNIVLHLYGDPYPANPLSINADKVKKLQRETSNCCWHGHVNDIYKVYKESHIAVLSSYREGLPKALIEAAACGLPIITTDTPGCREICQHKVNGLLVPVKDAESLANAILYFVNNPGQIDIMGNAGRQIVEQEFSDSIVHQKTWQVYQSIMQNAPLLADKAPPQQ